MRRNLGAILLAGVVLGVGVSAWPAVAQTESCQLAPVFMMLRELVGKERAGDCTGPVIRSDAGDLSQPTARGTMTFRSGDLVTAFSDGQTTWLFGPRGLESRPNTSRLPWETVGTPPPSGPITSSFVSSTGTLPPAPLPSPATLTSLPIKLEGDAALTTRPIDLAGGEYRITWDSEMTRGHNSCYVGSRLRRFGDQNPGELLFHATLNTSNDRTSSGETRLFGVAPGRYVLDVMTTGCAWKLTIQLPR